MGVILPFRGEFGLKIRFHVPAVYAMRHARHRVCVEPGEEALYPGANGYVECERREDRERHGMKNDGLYISGLMEKMGHGTKYLTPGRGDPEERFVPEPTVRVGVNPMVVVCPRKRKYGPEKNWPHWAELEGWGAGAPDSSFGVGSREGAWDHERFLDATIEAMLGARLVVATDAGLAHLAVLCGVPLLLITYKGRPAPGPVRNALGDPVQPSYWPVRMDEYYHAANHRGSPITVCDHWHDPDKVQEAISDLLTTPVLA